MRNLSLAIAALVASVCTGSLADTITWTGAGGDKLWTNLANWQTSSGASPASVPLSAKNSGDQIVISGTGVEVEYNGGDPYVNETESITVSNGAKLTQTVASWWQGENGTVTIDGGTFDTGSCSGTHTWSNFSVSNGGTLIARTSIPTANISLDDASFYEMISNNSYAHKGGEKFTKFTSTGQNVELQVGGNDEPVFDEDIIWNCNLISATGIAVQWNKGSLVLWDTVWGGYYNAEGGSINIAEGWTGSFTFAYQPSVVFASCFRDKIKYNGEALTAETFDRLFKVEATTVTDPSGTVHPASRVSLMGETSWRLGQISATDITHSGAILSVAVAEVAEGVEYSVYFAYGQDIITEDNIIESGEVLTQTGEAYSKTLTDLVQDAVYHYGFAIVVDGKVEAFKSDSFLASDYKYVYNNGWVNGNAPSSLNISDAVLVASDYTTPAEVLATNKTVTNCVLTAAAIFESGLEAVNARVVATRKNAIEQVPYDFLGASPSLNFTTMSVAGSVYRAPSYVCRCTDEMLDGYYDSIIAGRRIVFGGETITAEFYGSNFSLQTIGTEEGSYNNEAVKINVVELAYWEPLPAGSADTWTFHPGARVKLAKNTHIGAVALNESDDVKIDLNGFNLTVSALTVNGEKKTGVFTSAILPGLLAGDGSLVVGGRGFAVVIR